MAVLEALLFYFLLIVATLLIAKRKTWIQTLNYLGLQTKKPNVMQIMRNAAILVFIIFISLTVLSIILSLVIVDDSQKVSAIISTLSLPAILVAVTIGPFAEELFFRGWLQKNIGVVLSALIFAGLHFSFGSIAEIFGALVAGLVIGYWVKYRDSNLWPAIIAHAVYNAISILLVLVIK